MAKGTTQGPNPDADAAAASKRKFLGNIPKGFAERNQDGTGNDTGAIGEGAKLDDAGSIDPVTLGNAARASARTGKAKRKYTKRAAADAASGKAKAKVVVEEPADVPVNLVEQMALGIFSVHQMLAMGMQSPELALTQQEADALAKALANVGKYYVAIKLGGASGAWLALVTTAGIIYVPRIMTIRNRVAGAPGVGHNGGPIMSDEAPLATDLHLFNTGDERPQ